MGKGEVMDNFKVVYFPGAEPFWNFRGDYPLEGSVSPGRHLEMFGHNMKILYKLYQLFIVK